MAKLLLDAGDTTEDLLQFLTSEVGDATLDSMEIEREIANPTSLASEPVTTAVLLTLTPVAAAAVLRIVERWLEARRQGANLRMVLVLLCHKYHGIICASSSTG